MGLRFDGKEFTQDCDRTYDKDLVMLWYHGNWYFFREKDAKSEGRVQK